MKSHGHERKGRIAMRDVLDPLTLSLWLSKTLKWREHRCAAPTPIKSHGVSSCFSSPFYLERRRPSWIEGTDDLRDAVLNAKRPEFPRW